MISKFKAELREPENVICKQYGDSSSFYLVAKGACEATIIDQKKVKRKGDIMHPGEFFGEISLVYGCNRTASVLAVKYSTLAVLTKADYKFIKSEFPDLDEEFKKRIYLYDDRLISFIKESIQKVPYLMKDQIGNDALHDVMFNLNVKKYKKGDIL